MMLGRGTDWGALEGWKQRGWLVHRQADPGAAERVPFKIGYVVDYMIPRFTDDRRYIERHLEVEAR